MIIFLEQKQNVILLQVPLTRNNNFDILVPVSYTHLVQPLLNAIVAYMPSPLDIPAIEGVDDNEEPVERHASDEEPFSALAFKIVADPYVGKLAYFRVYSGTLSAGSYVYNSTKGKKERIGRILMMHANKREEVDSVSAGDIAAAVGLKDTTTGDTLCDMNSHVILEKMEFPEPVSYTHLILIFAVPFFISKNLAD